MEIQLFTRNMELTPRLQEYVEKKVSKLSRYLPNITDVRVDLSVENTRSSAQRQVAQLTIRTPQEGSINVVYRRRDGDYGLIIPELR
jgi:ribosomal subunit interface protein